MYSFIALLLNILSTTIITLFIIVPSTNGDNAKYTSCSAPYSCGTIQNIRYPFWGDNRPNFCGMHNFKLSCDGNNITSFEIFQNFSFGLSVHDINTKSHTVEFNVKFLLDYCYLQEKNHTLLPNLKTVDPNRNITLFYGCNNKKCESYKSKSFKCSTYNYTDDTSGTAYYFGNHSDIIGKVSKSCSCKNNISVPVAKRWFDEVVTSRDNASFLSALKKQLIETQYNASFNECDKCNKSGGMCGSVEDPSSDQFVCYCKNGAKPSSVCSLKSEGKRFKVILGLGIAGAVLVLVAIISIWHYKKPIFVTRSASLGYSATKLEKGGIYFGVPLFSYSELVEATANFDQSNEIGNGGFGIVYYGKLKDGREVAVKRLYEKSYKRVEQFMNEVKILTRLRHQNLVALYGCTSLNSKEPLLVYEYVRNGTLADHLYGETSTTSSLPWSVRLRIATETATALSYLHASNIIHRDVKTNNILLDTNFSVKVADFGLSRLFPTDVTHVSTAPLGTPGYLDPEYYQCYHLTDKSDVYSFGVVLVQLISSLPAVDLNRYKHEINLSNYAVNKIQHGLLDQLLDPQLGFRFDYKVKRMATLVGELAFQCLQSDKEFRPKMNEVLDVLNRIIESDDEYGGLSLQVDDKAKNVEPNHEHANLLSNQRLFSSSPMSVVENWVSKSTTLSS